MICMGDIYVLGVSMSRHDRAACLLKNGAIVAAIGEERLDRRKRSIGSYGHQPRRIVLPPLRAINYVLRAAGITLEQLDLIVCGRSMTTSRETLLAYLPVDPARVLEPAMPGHHTAHAYSAYATSPFDQAAILVIDEQGQHLPDGTYEKAAWFEALGGPIKPLASFLGTDENLSLGMFYNAFALLTSLNEASAPAAGKLMGLAAFGKAHPEWPQLIDLDENNGDTCILLQRLNNFFGLAGLDTLPGYEDAQVQNLDDLTRYRALPWSNQLAADLAFKAQQELEEAVLHISRALNKNSSSKVLAYAGGVALNCTTNRRLLETGWRDVFVHPAATDDGNAIGLAYYGWIEKLGHPHRAQRPFNPLTGVTYPENDFMNPLAGYGLAAFARLVSPAVEAAERIARGEIVCWHQGGSEWGPRALGSRSILADPRLTGIRDRINSTVKFREPFRPFAISTLAEALPDLVVDKEIPQSLKMYMLAAGQAADKRLDPVKHVDGTLRFQVVDPLLQPEFAELIRILAARTGLAAVLNTSFNTLGEPLVETPSDALRQFLLSAADALIVGKQLIVRAEIPAGLLRAARKQAFSDSVLEPLQAALGLEASGYPEQALSLLQEMVYSDTNALDNGPSEVLRYHAFLMRCAIRSGDLQLAHEHARVILEWSGLPVESLQAALTIAEHPLEDHQVMLGNLLASLGVQGGTWKFIADMFQGNPVPASF
jgi:carbamoyltransferase